MIGKRIFDITNTVVNKKNTTAVVGIEYVFGKIYVLTTHSGDGETKQPCVLHIYDPISHQYDKKVIKTKTGKTKIAVHANSISHLCHDYFAIVTRNGKGKGYSQVIVIDAKSGKIINKYEYSSMIATVSGDAQENYITVNGGNAIKYRRVYYEGNQVKQMCNDVYLVDHELPEDSFGNDIYKKGFTVITTKTESDLLINWLTFYGINSIRNVITPYSKKIVMPPLSNYTKFEVEGVCKSQYDNMLYIAVNGVHNGTEQDDAVWSYDVNEEVWR